jgi:hypothetical protein
MTAKKEVRLLTTSRAQAEASEIPDCGCLKSGALPTVVARRKFGALQTGVVDAQENPLYLIWPPSL